jgi:ubiquinone/menaquinone biosynthesis C-methylase UbiE
MTAYIHGFSGKEQARLLDQARILAHEVIGPLHFAPGYRVLELGCGVGAQLELLCERFPDVHFTGIDRNPEQVACACEMLRSHTEACRVDVALGDATNLPFADAHFDAVLTIWVLEHVPEPEGILREALRVLKPGGKLILTEVENATFAFDPPMPAITEWWDALNTLQRAAGGDPDIGPKIHEMLTRLGATVLESGPFPNIDSQTGPHSREVALDYLEELLLSAWDVLSASGFTEREREALREDFSRAKSTPDQHFRYHAWRVVGLRD